MTQEQIVLNGTARTASSVDRRMSAKKDWELQVAWRTIELSHTGNYTQQNLWHFLVRYPFN